MTKKKKSKTIQHLDPVWRDKADYILRVRIPGSFSGFTSLWEQLWARKISDDLYEICCIPFFLYDVSLGDHVKTDRDDCITEVVERSGHYTFRVWFGDSKDLTICPNVLQAAHEMGCLLEFYNPNLLGIDASTLEMAEHISGYLLEKQQSGLLVYETGQMKPIT